MEELYKELARIQQVVKVPKKNTNEHWKYQYRTCSNILESIKPHLKGLSLHLSDKMINVPESATCYRIYVEATATLSNGKEKIEATAYAREAASRKNMDDSQITGSTSSYARKYALCALFAIDDTKDADSDELTAKRLAEASGTPYRQPVRSQVPIANTQPARSQVPVSQTPVSSTPVKSKPMATVTKTYGAPSKPDDDSPF